MKGNRSEKTLGRRAGVAAYDITPARSFMLLFGLLMDGGGTGLAGTAAARREPAPVFLRLRNRWHESKHLHSTRGSIRMSAPDVREHLLQAALRVYAVSGLRGATTRRIAQEAGVNEVTLFRHFGSKDALIHEALAWESHRVLDSVELPAVPVDPEAELMEFCARQHRDLWASRALIRTCMAEFAENPEPARLACESPNRIADALQAYLRRLRDAGLARGDWSPRAASAMLMGTVFADAMGRDCMPDRFLPADEAIRQYVRLFLRAIGWVEPAPVRHATRPAAQQVDHPDRGIG